MFSRLLKAQASLGRKIDESIRQRQQNQDVMERHMDSSEGPITAQLDEHRNRML